MGQFPYPASLVGHQGCTLEIFENILVHTTQAPAMATSQPDREDLLLQILNTLQSVQNGYNQLSQAVQNIQGRLEGIVGQGPSPTRISQYVHNGETVESLHEKRQEEERSAAETPQELQAPTINWNIVSPQQNASSGLSSRIVLTTYPGQSGIDPILMNWGHSDPVKRGPVVVSRSQNTIRRRNGTRLIHKACLYALESV